MFAALLDSTANFELNFKYETDEKEASYDSFGFGYFLKKNNSKITLKSLKKL